MPMRVATTATVAVLLWMSCPVTFTLGQQGEPRRVDEVIFPLASVGGAVYTSCLAGEQVMGSQEQGRSIKRTARTTTAVKGTDIENEFAETVNGRTEGQTTKIEDAFSAQTAAAAPSVASTVARVTASGLAYIQGRLGVPCLRPAPTMGPRASLTVCFWGRSSVAKSSVMLFSLVVENSSLMLAYAPGNIGLSSGHLRASVVTGVQVELSHWNHICVHSNNTNLDLIMNGKMYSSSLPVRESVEPSKRDDDDGEDSRWNNNTQSRDRIKNEDGYNRGVNYFTDKDGVEAKIEWSSHIWRSNSTSSTVRSVLGQLEKIPRSVRIPLLNKRKNNPTNFIILILGSFDGKQNFFSGRFSDIRVFEKSLSRDEMILLATCSDQNLDGIQMALEYESANINVGKIVQKELCKSPADNHVIIENISTHQKKADSMCKLFNGFLPKLHKFGDVHMFSDTSFDIQEKEFTFWISNQTNLEEFSLQNNTCHSQTVIHGVFLVHDMLCSSWPDYLICHVPRETCLTMLYRDEGHKMIYGRRGEDFVLASKEGLWMTYDESQQTRLFLKDTYGANLASYPCDSLTQVIGKHSWNDQLTKQSVDISLSVCGDQDFTCSDGRCIALLLRCDGYRHCHDSSDEVGCGALSPPAVGYHKHLVPEGGLQLVFKVAISDVHDINMKDNRIMATIRLIISWSDPRLEFMHLRMNSTGTLTTAELNNIWVPRVTIKQASFEDNYNILLNNKVFRLGYLNLKKDPVIEIRNGSRALVQQGQHVELHFHTILDITVGCQFNLAAYPFDIQRCPLVIDLVDSNSQKLSWDSGRVRASLTVPQNSLYTMLQGEPMVRGKGNSTVEVPIILVRWYGSYLLTSILPSLVLMMAGIGTLLLPVDQLTDRLSATLACLIVIASLFSQISSTLPESATAKVIEVWLFNIICRMFFVFGVHVLLYRIPPDNDDKPAGQSKVAESPPTLQATICSENNYQDKRETTHSSTASETTKEQGIKQMNDLSAKNDTETTQDWAPNTEHSTLKKWNRKGSLLQGIRVDTMPRDTTTFGGGHKHTFSPSTSGDEVLWSNSEENKKSLWHSSVSSFSSWRSFMHIIIRGQKKNPCNRPGQCDFQGSNRNSKRGNCPGLDSSSGSSVIPGGTVHRYTRSKINGLGLLFGFVYDVCFLTAFTIYTLKKREQGWQRAEEQDDI